MKFDEQTIRSLLADQNITQGIISHKCGAVGLGLFIERLTAGLNHVIETATEIGYVKEELAGLAERYEENCAAMDIRLATLVKACKHPSWTVQDQLAVCNICGGLVDEEMF